MANPLNDPKLAPITHMSNEPPLEFMTRHGYEVQCLADCFTARRYTKPLKNSHGIAIVGRVCLEDWMGPTARSLATAIGWYP